MADQKPIRVMLVDDSAVIRGAITRLLKEDSTFEIVASLGNGRQAVENIETRRPDIIILDVEMPVMDGLRALPLIMEKDPHVRVIMFSSLTEKGAEVSVKAMALGAVECLVKPQSGEAKPGSEFQKNLIATIKNIADSAPPRPDTPAAREEPKKPEAPRKRDNSFTLRDDPSDYRGRPALLAIGSSTGGPQALFRVIKHMKGLSIPIILTQHMPATFTKILADHITSQTGVPAQEGGDGMPLKPGEVILAPGGKHMILKSGKSGTPEIVLDDGPPENFCKPAVDPMLRSAIALYGKKVLCVILTGMGHDGLKSAEDLVKEGGRVIAQDEASSVVWGMPGAVARAGICSAVLPLDEIGPWIRNVTG